MTSITNTGELDMLDDYTSVKNMLKKYMII